MKRIGSIVASVGISFPLDDVRPEAGFSPHRVTDLLGNRYNFRLKPAGFVRGSTVAIPGMAGAGVPSFGIPTSFTGSSVSFGPAAFVGGATGALTGVLQEGPASFRSGALETEGRSIAISQLDVSLASDPGGIAVQAVSTDAGDDVVADILIVLESEFGFRNLNQVVTMEYLSNVVVTFDQGIEERMKELKAIQDIINSALGAQAVAPVGLERITFGADLTIVPAARMSPIHGFVLERRANHSFAENRYFSSAPLKTSDHFAVLERIGAIIEERR